MTDHTAREALRQMMRAFIRGDDRSLNFVNRLEELLRNSFRAEPIYEELVVDLATYSPGGGEFPIDEDELARELQFALDHFLNEADR